MQATTIEEWRDIEGYEGLYQVSNLGRIMSLPKRGRRAKALSLFTKPSGYLSVTLSKDGKLRTHLVHRLVAAAFIPNSENRVQVNHIDGCKENNAVANLEWVTRDENIRHSWETGLRDIDSTYKNRRRAVIRDDGMVFRSVTEAAEQSGTSKQSIWKVLNGTIKKTRGHSFRYADEAA